MMGRLGYWGKFLDKYGTPINKRDFSVFMFIKELHTYFFRGGKKKYTKELLVRLLVLFRFW